MLLSMGAEQQLRRCQPTCSLSSESFLIPTPSLTLTSPPDPLSRGGEQVFRDVGRFPGGARLVLKAACFSQPSYLSPNACITTTGSNYHGPALSNLQRGI